MPPLRHRCQRITCVALATSLLFVALAEAAATGAGESDRPSGLGLAALSVVSDDTDALRRFKRSLEWHGLEFVPVRDDARERQVCAATTRRRWERKLDLIHSELARLERERGGGAVVLVTDGYNVIVNGRESVILDAYHACDCHVLLAADDICGRRDTLPTTAADVEENDASCVQPAAGYIGELRHVTELLERGFRHRRRDFRSNFRSDDGGSRSEDEAEERAHFASLLREASGQQWAASPFDAGSLRPGMCAASEANVTEVRKQLLPTSPPRSGRSSGVCTTLSHNVRGPPLKIRLDTKRRLFQSLDGSTSQLEVQFAGTNGFLYNLQTDTAPAVIFGSRRAKVNLNSLGNYLAGEWSPSAGCVGCQEGRFSLRATEADGDRSHYPPIFAALFAEKPTPFLSAFYECFENLDYPPEKIDLFVFNQEPYNEAATKAFVRRATGKYRSVRYISDKIGIRKARNAAVAECLGVTECLHFLSLDSDAQLYMPRALSVLIGQNRSLVAPLLTRPGRLWSNFWGALSSDGYYARSDDYLDIVTYKKIGLWNVPFVASVMLVNGSSLRRLPKDPYNYRRNLDDDKMSFCANAREAGIFMHLDNQHSYGHLINIDDFNSTRASPELFELFSNTAEWRRKYVHPNYSEVVDLMLHVSEPCPDVYWFPMMSEAFCDDMVNMMESFGQWSNGDNKDSRLQGGYESVPTRDIHMSQVGFEQHWLAILQHYVQPIQRLLYTGYQSQNKALLNFVVRYRPDEQPSLRPHHDTSTFTLNMALNTPGVDYEGGGVHFIRYNCSLQNLRKGWALLHPGRLTHYHEGLATTKGTRYIMVSFVDP